MNSSTLTDATKTLRRPLSVRPGLVVIETHPIQYHVPVYRTLQQDFGIPVTVIYGSDFSIAGYHDREFGAAFAWDTDLLSGYTSVFLSRSERGGAQSDREVNIRGLEAALAAAQPQALLCVGYSPQFHIQAFRCAYRTRKPILFRGETSDHAVRRSAIKKAFRDVVLRRLYRKCSALLYVGSRSRQHYERLGVADESLFFSPYCVDTTPFKLDESSRSELRGAVRRELGIPEDRLVIAFSGKLSRRKAPDQIIEAVKRFPAEIRERSVVLTIGDGELRDSLQAAANEAPTVAIRQVGFQHQMNLSRYYHSADVLVLPSVHGETWGLVVNEALHHGLPAVVSDSVGCAPDLIEPGKTGQVYRGGSVEGLSAALIDCLPLVGVAAARSNCRARVARYTTVRAAEGIATAWQASCRSVYQRKLAWMRD